MARNFKSMDRMGALRPDRQLFLLEFHRGMGLAMEDSSVCAGVFPTSFSFFLDIAETARERAFKGLRGTPRLPHTRCSLAAMQGANFSTLHSTATASTRSGGAGVAEATMSSGCFVSSAAGDG